MEFNYGGHSVYKTQYHVVWVTKYRRKTLNSGFASYTKQVILEIISKIDGIKVEEINVQVDHVHMLINIPPKYAVSKIIEIIKSQSTKIIRGKFPWFDKVYYGTNSFWSTGYFVSTVGINEEIIRRYVKYQQKQNSGQAMLEFS